MPPPPPPHHLYAKANTSTTIYLHWGRPAFTSAQAINYTVRCNPVGLQNASLVLYLQTYVALWPPSFASPCAVATSSPCPFLGLLGVGCGGMGMATGRECLRCAQCSWLLVFARGLGLCGKRGLPWGGSGAWAPSTCLPFHVADVSVVGAPTMECLGLAGGVSCVPPSAHHPG